MSVLTKKYGPLPGYAWGLVGLGAIGLGLYLRARNAANAGSAASAPVGYSAGSVDPQTGIPYDLEGAGVGGISGGGTDTPPPSLSDELGDVTNLLSNLRDSGLMPSAPVQQTDGVGDLVSLIGSLQQAGLVAPAIGQNPAPQTTPQLGVATTPPARAKGANQAPPAHQPARPVNVFTNATSGETYALVQKPSAAHHGALSDYRFYAHRPAGHQYVYVGPVGHK